MLPVWESRMPNVSLTYFSIPAMRVNTLLIILPSTQPMLVSHRYKFVLFPDPLGTCSWISHALQPWLDQPIPSNRRNCSKTLLHRDMSPAEAAQAFDRMDFAFEDYTRIAVIRNPYAKMAQLYYRLAIADPVWRARLHLGFEPPRFNRWLRGTRVNGTGAGYRGSRGWRRFGAWSADAWCGDQITHMVRASNAAEELTPIFNGLGISPAFGHRTCHDLGRQRLARLYDKASCDLVRERYAADLALYQRDAPELRLIDGGKLPMDKQRYRFVA